MSSEVIDAYLFCSTAVNRASGADRILIDNSIVQSTSSKGAFSRRSKASMLTWISLPKGGPVQTTYEEKLWLYSLYKQGDRFPNRAQISTEVIPVAMEGDVWGPRPGMLDMLSRAKWYIWALHRYIADVDQGFVGQAKGRGEGRGQAAVRRCAPEGEQICVCPPSLGF